MELVPISMFLAITIIFGLLLWFRFRARQELQLTIRSAIERGQDLSPEVLASISDSLSSKFGDLRRGILAIAVGIGFFVFANLIGEEDAVGPLLGISAFPFAIGIGYVGLWFFTRTNKNGAD